MTEKAVILAAGRGSRLGSLTDGVPKGLLPINGKTLIERHMEALRQFGIEDVAVVTGYKSTLHSYPAHYFHNAHWSSTNSVRSLLLADSWLSRFQCLVLYSDVYFSPDLIGHLACELEDLVVPSYQHWRELWCSRFQDPLVDLETFRADEQSILIDIGGPPDSLDEIQGQFMGVLKLSPQGWSGLKKLIQLMPSDAVDQLDVTRLLRFAIKTGIRIKTINYAGKWFEVDTPSDFDRLNIHDTSEQERK